MIVILGGADLNIKSNKNRFRNSWNSMTPEIKLKFQELFNQLRWRDRMESPKN